MAFTNSWPPIGITDNPLTKSVFIETWNDSMLIPPPGADYIVTENNIILATENGDELTTE